jgi:hypothetical protein
VSVDYLCSIIEAGAIMERHVHTAFALGMSYKAARFRSSVIMNRSKFERLKEGSSREKRVKGVSEPILRRNLRTTCTTRGSLPGLSNGIALSNIRHSRVIARALWDDAVQSGDVCIDATCGRGSDALYLARLAGKEGIVHALDIQPQAIEETRRRFAESFGDDDTIAEVNAVQRNHTDFSGLSRVDGGTVSVVTYNLGWYPGDGADKSVITRTETTIMSLHAVSGLVRIGGVVTVMAYVGHVGGLEEAEAVDDWASRLDKHSWSTTCISYPNRANAPRLFVFQRVG